jgi:hypothetical protein
MAGNVATIAQVSIRTPFAGRYAAQLVSHWKHHNPVLDVTGPVTTMRFGATTYVVEPDTEALSIRIETADSIALEKAQRAIEEHIDRFGFREKQGFDWTWHSPAS